MTQETNDVTVSDDVNLRSARILVHCKKLMMVMVMLLSCFFLSIPSGTYQAPQSVLSISRVVGPFPVPQMQAAADPFPFPEGLRPQVDFWKKIFSEYSRNQVVIHDSRYLDVIYEVVDTSKARPPGQRDNPVKAAREKYKQLLENLPWDTPQKMSKEERRIYSLFKNIPESPIFKKEDAENRVRSQRGHVESFKTGLTRSGKYLDTIKQIFAKYNLPEGLTYLPMIESGFDPLAVSHAGAAGIWQFMRRTGKHYHLTISDFADERRDPFLSSYAAARLLKDNYNELKSWPLAITAYNHGAKGLKRAVKQLGTSNIADIVRGYDGPRFEFASRNFYAEFLAALELGTQHAKYFGEIEFNEPLEVSQVKLPDYIAAETLEKYLEIPADDIRNLNPALNPSVFRPGKFIPKEYQLNVLRKHRNVLALKYEAIPVALRYDYIPPKKKHRVRKGQTLSEIARAHNSSMKAFMKLNGIRNPQRIRSGQLLKVPGEYISLDGGRVSQLESRSPLSSKRDQGGKGIRNPQHIRSGQWLKVPGEYVSLDGGRVSQFESRLPLFLKTKHRVRKGQTLMKIAKLYNTSAKAIVKFNAISNPQRIRAGQLLKIPEG